MKRVKRISFIAASVCLMVSLIMGGIVFSLSPKTIAYATDNTPDFFDDFNGYDVSADGKFVEDDAAYRTNWENELMLNIDGDASAANDVECKGVAKIVLDPTAGATNGNKVVHLKNFDPIGSFFYMAPKGLRTKDFVATYKVYNRRAEKEPWFGLSVRKSNNVRYNGCDNMLLNHKVIQGEGMQAMNLSAFRGYSGAGNPQDKTADLSTTKGLEKADWKNSFNNLVDGVVSESRNTVNTWIEMKMEVKSTTEDGKAVTKYITSAKTSDGAVHDFGTLTYGSKNVNGYGYISFNACIVDMYLDDFKIENKDEAPPPVILQKPKMSVAVSNATADSFDFLLAKEDPDNAILQVSKIVAINAADEKDIVELSDLTATKIAGLKSDTEYKLQITFSYDIDDGNGTIDAYVLSSVIKTLPGEVKPTPTPETKPGCGSALSIGSISLVGIGALALLGISLIVLKKKKKNI